MKSAVLKLSGKTLNEFLTTDKWINTVQHLLNEYDGLVIVHGAGKTITEWSSALGIETEFVNGQRVTTEKMMDVVAAVQAGMLNIKLTAKLNSSFLTASGFSGVDKNTFVAKYLDKELGFVGMPEVINSVRWIHELMEQNVIPVFSSVCRDVIGNLMNVNADVFAGVIASAIKADTVFYVSDVEGVLINGEKIDALCEEEILCGIASNDITGGMIPKLKSCVELVKDGVNKVWIGSELSNFKNNTGIENGTWIIKDSERKYKLLGTA